MKPEIYEDVLKEEPENIKSKEYKKWEKRLTRSIGYIDITTMGRVIAKADKQGRLKPDSHIIASKEVYDVELGAGFSLTCDKLVDAVRLSLIVHVNERLKRIEEKLDR